MTRNHKAYLAELEDIPGTRVFTAGRARKGYWLNQFCMSLMKPENRERWKANEAAYLKDWKMSDAECRRVQGDDDGWWPLSGRCALHPGEAIDGAVNRRYRHESRPINWGGVRSK